MRWIDTKTSASLKHAKLPDGSINLVIVGLNPASLEWGLAIKHMKMRPPKSGQTLMRHGGKFALDEVVKVFPAAKPVDLSESEVYLGIVPSSSKAPLRKMSEDERKARADLQTYFPLGVNYLGQEVFAMSDGQRFVNANSGVPISENAATVPAAFLRAFSDEDLALCADGFVRMMDTRMLRAEDMRRFGGVVYNEDRPLPITDLRLRKTQEVIEAAIFRSFAEEHQEASFEAFQKAVHIDNHQPVMGYRNSESVINQQYSTPLLLSVATQHILGGVSGKKLLEPTIGNGSLVSLLRGANITGCEISEGRSAQVAGIFGGDVVPTIIKGDFTQIYQNLPADFDVVIGNPPFGGLDKPVSIMGLQATRIDHQITLQALSRLKAEGRAVFIVGGDRDGIYKENAGNIEGGSRRFFAWLADHYDIRAFEVSGSMYAKQGANYPVRVISVRGKFSPEDAAARKKGGAHRLSKLQVVETPAELWDEAVASRAWMSNAPAPISKVEIAEVRGEYQAQYIPLSKVGEPSSMVPVNLAAPMANAFARLQKSVGDIDEFVKKELKLPNLSFFTPEQVDAIALAIFNARRNRGLILADQTGQGKGRIVAALARYSAINGKMALFLTDTPNLFSDFWRDIKDIESDDVFKPFILNVGESVIDITETGEVEIPKTPVSIQKEIVSSGKSPIEFGYNLALMTYSQFNRLDSSKAKWLGEAARDAYLILDEAHKAAGESNTSMAIAKAIENSWSVTYSSATYAKDAKNMLIYAKAFPPSVNLATLSQTLAAGGEALQEVISAMLCDDGALVRRERDLSHLKFEMVSPGYETLQRNRNVADKVSRVLSMMSFLSGDVEKVVGLEDKRIQREIKNRIEIKEADLAKEFVGAELEQKLAELPIEIRKNNRMGVSYVNFGSRLYTIQRQLMLVLAADTVVGESLRILELGGKPVIAVEQTMETLLKELLDDDARDVPITFGDLLRRMVNNVVMISRRDDYGNSEKASAFQILDEMGIDTGNLRDVMGEINALIADVPNLSAMPLDVIKQGIEDAGYAIGEISGRGVETREYDGKVHILERNVDRSKEVFAFNNRDYDAILLTGGAAATGISLHASEAFGDKRQRFLIEAQIANDVAKRVQLFGRVDRRGQVSSPGIKSVTSGLPCETRTLAMQNQKLRSMSANTQSNRSNASEMKDIPDMLNHVGDAICREFLFSNPQIARTLSIELSEDQEREDPTWFVNKLTGRISLLPVSKQEEIYDLLLTNYKIRMDELNSIGMNPFKSHTLDVKAEVTKSFVLHKKGGGDSLFDAPIVAEKIEWAENVEPIRMARVKELAAAACGRIIAAGDGKENQNISLIGAIKALDMGELLKRVHSSFLELARRSVPIRFTNLVTAEDPDAGIKAALADAKDNIIKKIDKRHDWIDRHGRQLTPGRGVTWETIDGRQAGIVVNLKIPDEGREHHLGQWSVDVAIPGKEFLVTMTFNQLFDDEHHHILDVFDTATLAERFDKAKAGEVVYSRWILTGNLFAATESAVKRNIGRAGMITMKDGSHRRAVICTARVSESNLRNMPISIATPEECIVHIRSDMAEKDIGTLSFGEGFSISWRNEIMTITTPGGKKNGGRIFADKGVFEKVGDFAGNREKMVCRFDARDDGKLEYIVRKMYSLGMTGEAIPSSEDAPRMQA